MDRCTRCIRPASHLSITFDEQGVCNYCRTFEKRHRHALQHPASYYEKKLNALRKAVEKEKKKGNKYQALLGISGGKDSAYALYLMKEKLGANVLCFTLTTDFFNSAAKANTERLIKTFGADHIWVPGPSNALFRHFLMKTGRACYACVISIVQPFHDLAKQHNIGLIVSGYSALTDGMDPEGTSPWFVKNVIQDGATETVYNEGMNLYQGSYHYMIDLLTGKLKLYNLGEYFPWDDEEIKKMFKQNYAIDFGAEHSDCNLHELAGLCAVKKYGFTLNMSKLSKYILLGRVSREEALRRIEEENTMLMEGKGDIGASLASAMEKLNLSEQDLELAFRNDDKKYRKGLLNRAVDFYRRNFYA